MYQIIARKWGWDQDGNAVRLAVLVADDEKDSLPTDLPAGSECHYPTGVVSVYFGEKGWIPGQKATQSSLNEKVEIQFKGAVQLDPGKMYVGNVAGMSGCMIELNPGTENVDNEWAFTLIMPANGYPSVGLPVIHWGLGIAPAFEPGTTIVCRLYYVGETLCGEWVSV